MTWCGSTLAVDPDLRISAWSMWLAPATMACTRLRTFRPGRKPPRAEGMRTRELTRGLETKALHDRRHEQEPGVGDEVVLVEGHLDPVDPARYWLH